MAEQDDKARLIINVDVSGIPPYADDAWSWEEHADMEPEAPEWDYDDLLGAP